LFKILGEFVAEELSSTVRAKTFNSGTVLILSPRRECFVSVESLVFGPEEVDPSPVSSVVSESDVVVSASKARKGGRPPKIGVNLFSEAFCQRGFMFLGDGFTGGLGIFTRIANYGGIVVYYCYALDGATVDKSANILERNVPKSFVQRENADLFLYSCG
jgi:hypothetical protein